MTDTGENSGDARSLIEGASVLRFAPHAKFRFDEVRQAWIVLVPERLLLPDEQAVEILHLVDGERDLVQLVRHAAEVGLYGNLITSGIRLDAARLAELAEAGLEHVQLSFQDSDMASGDRIAGFPGAQEAKRRAARLVREAGLPLTVNAVVHRQNLDRLSDIIELAVALGADRLEVAHVQYYGWALRNRAALMPS